MKYEKEAVASKERNRPAIRFCPQFGFEIKPRPAGYSSNRNASKTVESCNLEPESIGLLSKEGSLETMRRKMLRFVQIHGTLLRAMVLKLRSENL